MTDPASAAQAAAVLAGTELTRTQAERIASAVLGCADCRLQVSESAWREYWEIDHYRAAVRKTLRQRLLEGVLDRGCVPVSLPAETVRFMISSAIPGAVRVTADGRPTGGIEVAETAGWDTAEIVLEVAVRTPAADRPGRSVADSDSNFVSVLDNISVRE